MIHVDDNTSVLTLRWVMVVAVTSVTPVCVSTRRAAQWRQDGGWRTQVCIARVTQTQAGAVQRRAQ